MRKLKNKILLDYDPGLPPLIDKKKLAFWLSMLDDEVESLKRFSFQISVKFVSIESMQQLNLNYIGKDKTTNVLAFSSGFEFREKSINFLGDIALCLDVLSAEAEEQKKSLEDHIAHLFLHGVLHLLGYDHMTKNSTKKMENIEIKVLNKLDIAFPY